MGTILRGCWRAGGVPAGVSGRQRAWDVEGPVQAEVYVVWLDGDRIAWTGPCGAAPWLLELGATDHPVEVVDRIVRDVIGPPLLVHSTSWRRDRDAVILSFIVVIEPGQVGTMDSVPVDRAGAGTLGRHHRTAGDRPSAGHRARPASPRLAGRGRPGRAGHPVGAVPGGVGALHAGAVPGARVRRCGRWNELPGR